MTNQQTMMQFIQTGEVYMQRGDKLSAIKYFSYAASISYIGSGVKKAEQLLRIRFKYSENIHNAPIIPQCSETYIRVYFAVSQQTSQIVLKMYHLSKIFVC